jgi:pantoate--beta-alanine ligase
MQILYGVNSTQKFIAQKRREGLSCGFVPTMGALHAGHLTLLEHARKDNDLSVCSVYVNPAQFNNPRDLEQYPRDLEQDIHMLEQAGCDLLFCPVDEEMYPQGKEVSLTMDFGPMSRVLEGEFRPGHFSGVGLVVAKLMNIVKPDRAYFGQKDLQQCSIINKLLSDLFFEVELVTVPTVRETSGLAMSSRNRRLSPEGRKVAANLYVALQAVAKDLKQDANVEQALHQGLDVIAQYPEIQLEYLEIVERTHFTVVRQKPDEGELAVCIAAYVEGVRLIDNLLLFSQH